MNNISLIDGSPSSSPKRTERLSSSSSPSPPSSSGKKQRRSTPSAQDGGLERLHGELAQSAVLIQKAEQEIDHLDSQLKAIDAQLLAALDPDVMTYVQCQESQLNKEDTLRNEEGCLLQNKALAFILPLPKFASSPCHTLSSQVPLFDNISHHRNSWHRKIPLLLLLPSTFTPSEEPLYSSDHQLP